MRLPSGDQVQLRSAPASKVTRVVRVPSTSQMSLLPCAVRVYRARCPSGERRGRVQTIVPARPACRASSPTVEPDQLTNTPDLTGRQGAPVSDTENAPLTPVVPPESTNVTCSANGTAVRLAREPPEIERLRHQCRRHAGRGDVLARTWRSNLLSRAAFARSNRWRPHRRRISPCPSGIGNAARREEAGQRLLAWSGARTTVGEPPDADTR